MSSLGDSDEETQSIADISDSEARNFDPLSSPSLSGERTKDWSAEAVQFLQHTVPFDNTVPLEDAFETQLIDFDDETQLVDFDDETQLVDFDGETQLVDFDGETQVLDNLDCTEHMSTQLLDGFNDEAVIESDDEGSEKTELLSDNEILSDDNSSRSIGIIPVDEENMHQSNVSEQGEKGNPVNTHSLIDEQCDNGGLSNDKPVRSIGNTPVGKENVHPISAREQGQNGNLVEPPSLNDEQDNAENYVSTVTPLQQATLQTEPGSVRRGFTSVRSAALRASGLAARAMTLNGTKSGSLKQNVKENKISSVEGQAAVGTEVASENHFGECNNGLMNETGYRVSRSTIRKLFTEDIFSGKRGSTNNNDGNDEETDVSHFLSKSNKSAGLSYVDSQEPEEASQVNALDFVDKFIKDYALEFDLEINHRKTTKTKLSALSSAKGPQSLAKASDHRNVAAISGIFDWDVNREDEGGGEFFCQRKEELIGDKYHGRKSSSEPRKTRNSNFKGSRVNEFGDTDEKLKIRHKILNCVRSEPRSVRRNSKEDRNVCQDDTMKIKKKLANELDKQFNAENSGGEFEATGTDMDMPDMLNVGFDTQMAAEAMEALFHAPSLDNGDVHVFCQDNHDNNSRDSPKRGRSNAACTRQDSFQKRAHSPDSGVITRQSKKMKEIGTRLVEESSGCARSKKVRKQINVEPGKTKPEQSKSNSNKRFATRGSENLGKIPSKVTRKRKVEGNLERSHIDEVEGCHGLAASDGLISVKKRGLQREFGTSPVASRTRHRMVANGSGEETNNRIKTGPLNSKRKSSGAVDACEVSVDEEKLTSSSHVSGKLRSNKPSHHEQSSLNLTARSNDSKMDALSCPKKSRTRRKLSGQANKIGELDGTPTPFVGQEFLELPIPRQPRSKSKARVTLSSFGKKKIQPSSSTSSSLSSLDQNSEGNLLKQSLDKHGVGGDVLHSSVNLNRKNIPQDPAGNRASKHSKGNNGDPSSPAEGREVNGGLRETSKPSGLVCTTPGSTVTPTNAVSPVCMGNNYKQSCKKNLRTSLLKELIDLTDTGPRPTSTLKDSRRRREISNVRVLFSQHLDDEIIKQQKKILIRLGASVASSISDATHFVTDTFVRTRNMLEAIAYGKPVVTHLWLESCVQARCFIDERGYILRDAKKEKELGFSMPVSLARACEHPLLLGRKVLITPNTKPGKEIIARLVKAVDGQAMERIGRSVLKDDKFTEDLLILSCDEDYAACEPYLEKGAAVYSSELLLNGIVTQKLEYERHRLFVDNVKRTRSTIWMRRKGGHCFLPVTKTK